MIHINYKPKLLFLSLITVIFISILSLTILYELDKNQDNLFQTQQGVKNTQMISAVIHLMQIERGMLAGILAAKNENKYNALFKNIQKELDGAINQIKNEFSKKNVNLNLIKVLNEIQTQRKKLLLLDISTQELKNYYSNYIEQLLHFSRTILSNLKNNQNRNALGAYVNLVEAKESMGLIRAVLYEVFITKEFNDTLFYAFAGHERKYQANINQFNALAPKNIVALYEEVLQDEKVDKTYQIIKSMIKLKQKKEFEYDALQWFKSATYTIDKFKEIEKKLLVDIDAKLKGMIAAAKFKIFFIAIFLIISVITLFIFMGLIFRKVVHTTHALKERHDDTYALLAQYKQAVDRSFIVSKTDPYGVITYVNDEFCKISNYCKEELIGKPHNIVRHPDMPKEAFKQMWYRIKKEKKTWMGEVKNKAKDGRSYWVKAIINPILDNQGNVVEYIAVRNDITKVKNASIIDFLTGYGNRQKLINDIQKATNPSIAELNMDNFRQINDFYGHEFGDDVIITFAHKIYGFIEKEHNLQFYRLQGDEFVILADEWDKNKFEILIDTLLHHLKDELLVDDEKLLASYSCGISFVKDKQKLLLSANMALKIAKFSSSNYIVYNKHLSLNEKYKNNILWSKKLNYALKQGNIITYFQPIINNQTQQIEKYECLVRMIDKDKVVTPFFFLDVAKKTRQYFDITKIVIAQSFETFKNSDKEFSINLSINDITETQICDFIEQMLKKYEIGNRVVFEIVESEYIENFDIVIAFIQRVKKYGSKIAIDDFGTGYSNFAYLIKLKADYLKIDGSLIKDIDSDKSSFLVVSTIVSFAKKLGIKTVAEYVENEKIQKVVQRIEIDYSQGYHFSPPQKEIDTGQ